jgi:Tol biopolymer transport system component
MNLDGSHITQLTGDRFARLYFLRSASDEQPAWSPDGNYLAFVSGRDNSMMTYTDMNVYIMNRNGSNITRLTGAGSEEGTPSWSPDGKQLAYSSRDIFTSDGRLIENPTWDIYVINIDGSNPLQITNDPADDLEVAWAPDGKRIAFISDRNGHDFDIYVMNADGSDVVQLTTDSANDFGPAWSPDSSRIAFNSDRNGNVQLYVMNADGSDTVQLTTDASNSAYPSWSPDGSRILFESDRGDGNANIFVMNVDGTNVVQLTGQ